MKKIFLTLVLGILLVPVTLGAKPKSDQDPLALLLMKGDSCLLEHDVFHAIEYYSQYRESNPHDCDVLRKLASCYRQQGNGNKCISSLDSIPKDSLTHEDMRMYFFTYRDIKPANMVSWGMKIYWKYPYDSDVFGALLTYWNNANEPETVSALATSHIQKYDSTNIIINKELAYSLFLQMRYDQAVPHYVKLIADGFDNYESNFVLGLCYYNLEKYQEAFPYLQKAVELRADNPTMNSLFYLGMIYAKLSERMSGGEQKKKYQDNAIFYLNRSMEVAYPRSRGLYVNQQLANLYYRGFKYEDAAHAFAQCIEYDDDHDPINYYNVAQMYIAAGKAPLAKFYLQMFLDKSNGIKDEKERAKLVAKAKEQLKGKNQ